MQFVITLSWSSLITEFIYLKSTETMKHWKETSSHGNIIFQ